MNLLDIVGPVMVGPSSSHTAGAVKIGLVSRKLIDILANGLFSVLSLNINLIY